MCRAAFSGPMACTGSWTWNLAHSQAELAQADHFCTRTTPLIEPVPPLIRTRHSVSMIWSPARTAKGRPIWVRFKGTTARGAGSSRPSTSVLQDISARSRDGHLRERGALEAGTESTG